MPDQTEPPKKPPGRPAGATGKAKGSIFAARMSDPQKDKITEVGGGDWLRTLLDQNTVAKLLALIKPPKS